MPDEIPPAAQVQTEPPATIEPAPAPTEAAILEAAEARLTENFSAITGDQSGMLPTEAAEPDPAKPAEPVVVEPAKVEPAPPAEPEPPKEPAGEQPLEPGEVKVSDRPRITHLSEQDKIDQNAIILLTRKGMTLAEASQRVLGELGAKAPVAEAPPIPEAAPVAPALIAIDTEIASHEAVVAKIEEDRKAYEAEPSVFASELADLAVKEAREVLALTKLTSRRSSVEASETRQAELNARNEQSLAQATDARKTAFEAAQKVYPDLADKKTPLWAVTRQIAEEIRDPSHPDHAKSFEANAIDYCAAEAAKRLGHKPAEVAPVKAAIVAPKPGPARGSLATAQPAPAKSEAELLAAAEERFTQSFSPIRSSNQNGLLPV